MNRGIHYASVWWTFVFVSHCILPDRLHSRGQCPNARSLSVNSSFFIQCFSVIFRWMRPSKCILSAVILSHPVSTTHQISIWSPPTLLYHNWLLMRSRTPIRSRFDHRPRYYITIDFWSGLAHPSDAKSNIISQMSFSQYYMFGVQLSQVGRFAYKCIRLMSCLLSLQPCCPHGEYIQSFRVACV